MGVRPCPEAPLQPIGSHTLGHPTPPQAPQPIRTPQEDKCPPPPRSILDGRVWDIEYHLPYGLKIKENQ